MSNEFSHIIEHPWAHVSYWKGDCAVDKTIADHCEVIVPGHRHTMFSFELPRQRYECEKLLRMLQQAFERGKAHKSAEIGKMFKDLVNL